MDDLIFIATEECLMPQLMKIISACEKTHRGGAVAFLQQISSGREGIKEEGGRSSSSAPRLWVLICISAALTSPTKT